MFYLNRFTQLAKQARLYIGFLKRGYNLRIKVSYSKVFQTLQTIKKNLYLSVNLT